MWDPQRLTTCYRNSFTFYSPRGSWPLFQFHDHFTDGRTPWVSDQLVARPLSKYRTTQTEWTYTHTKHPCLVWDLNSDPSFRASEDSSCLRPLGCCDKPFDIIWCWKENLAHCCQGTCFLLITAQGKQFLPVVASAHDTHSCRRKSFW
jgi:hypothetical protein